MKKGLGRSFDSLIPTNLIDESFDPTAKQDGRLSQLKQLPIEQVMADPDQPRRMFDEEASLACRSESWADRGASTGANADWSASFGVVFD